MKKVLIIDDDEFHLHYMRAFFKKYFKNVRLDCASTFYAGVNLLNKEVYELLILDLILPDASIVNVLSGVNIENKVPVLVLSGVEKLNDTEMCLFSLLDAADFVSKDIGAKDLKRLIATKIMEYDDV